MGVVWGLLTSLGIGLSELTARRVVIARGALTAAVSLQFVAVFTSIAALFVVASNFDVGDLLVGGASGLGMAVGMWGYLGGLQRSTSTVVAPIVATMSAVVPYVYAVVRGADPSLLAVAGALVAVAGLVLITLAGGRVHHLATGLRWALVSGCGYGFGLSVVIEASEASGSWPAVGQRIVAFGCVFGAARLARQPTVPPPGLRVAALVAGVFAGLSTVFYLLGLEVDATSTVVTGSLFPAVSVAVGHLVYGDGVNGRQMAGIGVVLAGVLGVALG